MLSVNDFSLRRVIDNKTGERETAKRYAKH